MNTAGTACRRTCTVHQSSSSLMDYVRGWAWQTVLLQKRLALKKRRRQLQQSKEAADAMYKVEDCVLLLQHNPVYTLGRGADEKYLTFAKSEQEIQKLSRTSRGPESARLSADAEKLSTLFEASTTYPEGSEHMTTLVDLLCHEAAKPVLTPNGAPVYRVDRGGQVTFHGPNQLVVYPMFDLQNPHHTQDLHSFLRQTEEVIMNTCAEFGIESHRDDINTGVWVDQKKIAAVGVTASRWITTHGFAINVCPDLSQFDTSIILPCGIEGREVTSLEQQLCSTQTTRTGKSTPSLQTVADVVVRNIGLVFNLDMVDGDVLV